MWSLVKLDVRLPAAEAGPGDADPSTRRCRAAERKLTTAFSFRSGKMLETQGYWTALYVRLRSLKEECLMLRKIMFGALAATTALTALAVRRRRAGLL